MTESAIPYGTPDGEPICPDCGQVLDHELGTCICPVCNGTGDDPNICNVCWVIDPCPLCDGSGHILEADR